MKSHSKKPILGIFLVLIGVLFLLRSLDIIWFTPEEIVERLLPFGLIALGGWVIIRRKRKADAEFNFSHSEKVSNQGDETISPSFTASKVDNESKSESESKSGSGSDSYSDSHFSSTPDDSESGKLKFSKLIGELHIDCCNLDMKNTEISAFIGEIEVKVHGGKLRSGLNRMIISGFIGDIRIWVPKEMPVFVRCSSFVGEIEILGKRSSGFGNHIEGQTANYYEAEDKLFIAVSCFLADIRVYTI